MNTKLASLVIALATVFVVGNDGRAASLSGKVVGVDEGDSLTVYNLNRPVKVRLLAVDAPELDQQFGDLAAEHLRALLNDRFVTVEYWGLGQKNCLIGKVLLDGRDVGAQMIRDGVAWFDSNNKGPLSATDCKVYEESQRAAHAEKRGLWQSETAVAPWEFVKNEAAKREALSNLVRATNSRARSIPEFTNLNLIGTDRSSVKSFDNRGVAYNSTRKAWQKFQPPGENFSVLVPSDGKQVREPVQTEGGTIDIRTYIVKDGSAVYLVMWTSGPSRGERDVAVVKSSMNEVLQGISAGYASNGVNYACGTQSESDVSAKGFTGRDIDLSDCTVPTQMRIFTKAADSKRRIYLGAVFYTQPDANVRKFLHSLNVTDGEVPAPKVRSSVAEKSND